MFHACCSHDRWSKLPKSARCALFAVKAVALFAVFVLLFGYVTMRLWNAVLPDISSLPPLTFWQAVALLVLARLFTGRFSHGRHHHRHHHHDHHRHPFHHRSLAASPDLYAEWWDTEGEAAFLAYGRRRSQSPSADAHE
jgi:hypothetical protein